MWEQAFPRDPAQQERRRKRLPQELVVGANPTECLVRTPASVVEIRRLELRYRIVGQRIALRLQIDVIEPRRILPEDLRFVFFGDLLVAEFLAHLVADLESLE